MTAERAERVPEHPGWQPWWVRVAEFEGQRLVLIDRDCFPESPCVWVRLRYLVGTLTKLRPCPHSMPDCPFRNAHEAGPIHATTDDLAEAEAAFELACERLREGG